jgi:hypothetical protein
VGALVNTVMAVTSSQGEEDVGALVNARASDFVKNQAWDISVFACSKGVACLGF